MHARYRWLLPAVVVLVTGCEALTSGLAGKSRTGTSSSVVEFLYPDGAAPPKPSGELPRLQLPISVGLAFVPGRDGNREPLSEPQKLALLDQVRQKFTGEEYVRQIVIVPDAYLRGASGFDALDRAARMYGIDVIALVSYDQLSIASEKTSSIWYWTIVGAYLVEGSRNEVQTLVDTAVFDIPSRTLLFRAAGTDRLVKDATMVESPQRLREAQVRSFERAMQDMSDTLRAELEALKARLDQGGGPVRVESSGGGGAAGIAFALPGLVLLLWRPRRRAGRAAGSR